jgi:hypothetical protein
MKQLVLTVSIVLIGILEFNAQEFPEKENDTIIVWTESRKLNWADFQRPSHERTQGAQSDIGLSIVSTRTNSSINYVVFPYFYKQRSSTNSSSAHILKHEQIHFDIAEVYARKIRRKLKELEHTAFDRKRYEREIDRIYSAYLKEQEDFDKETGHSIVTEKQKIWEQKITSELSRLRSFKSKIFVD